MFLAFLFCCLCLPYLHYAQNLVPNGDFETYTTCPTELTNGTSVFISDFSAPWETPTRTTPDYFNRCAGNACFDDGGVCVPCNTYGCQEPHSGNGYAGFIAFTLTPFRAIYSEYLQVKLLDTLVRNEIYEVTFFISLAERTNTTFRHIGIYFSENGLDPGQEEYSIGVRSDIFPPQVETGFAISDKQNWVKIQRCYTARGGEEYITIGNFSTEDAELAPSPIGSEIPISYYYIDDVSIEKASFQNFPENFSICLEDTNTLYATTTDAASYLWQDSSTADSLVVTDTGLYTVNIKSLCYNRIHEIQVDYTGAPNNPAIDSLCKGDTALLTADISYNGRYEWSTGDTTLSIPIVEEDTFYLTTFTQCNDTFIDTIQIEYKSSIPFANLGRDSLLCIGDTLQIGDSLAHATSYVWQNGATKPYLQVTEPDLYSVTITTDCWAQEFKKEIRSYPTFMGFPDTVFCQQPITLTAENSVAAYTWPDGSMGNTFVIQQADTYVITIDHPCEVLQDTMEVKDCRCVPYVPNAFTPNGDEQNDAFKVALSCEIETFALSIYDRFGKQVFFSQDPQLSWGGTYKEEAVNSGVYVYSLHITFNGENVEDLRQVGNITLTR